MSLVWISAESPLNFVTIDRRPGRFEIFLARQMRIVSHKMIGARVLL